MEKSLTRQLFVLVLPILLVLCIALGITFLSISINAPTIPIVPYFQEGGTKSVINVLFFVGMASLSILFFYLFLTRGLISLLEKIIAIGGGVLTLTIIGILSIFIFARSTSFVLYLFVYFVMFFIILSIVFTITGVFPEDLENMVYMIYSAVSGSYLGIGVPTFSMLFIMISLCAIDIVFIRQGIMKNKQILAVIDSGKVFINLKYANRELIIGLADFVYYSMLASHTLANYGVISSIFSTLFILIGWMITFFYATRNWIVPGLPIPIGLGLIPIIIQFPSLL